MITCRHSPLICATLLVVACRPGDPAATLRPAYPDLLRQARIEGVYRFTVGLDSAGAPNLTQFRMLASPHLGFDRAVRRAVVVWRPHVPPGTDSLQQSVVFVILPHGADSARDCPMVRSYTLVCALEPSVTTLHQHVSQ